MLARLAEAQGQMLAMDENFTLGVGEPGLETGAEFLGSHDFCLRMMCLESLGRQGNGLSVLSSAP